MLKPQERTCVNLAERTLIKSLLEGSLLILVVGVMAYLLLFVCMMLIG